RLIMVLLESAVSGHKRTWIRERLADKVEFILFDPYIRQPSVYRERQKIRSLK
ncbi:39S ribosomal protein L33, mitochondrial, partial [Cryptotermes secundus]